MRTTALDHLHRETCHRAESVARWESVECSFVGHRGAEPHRADRLTGGRAVVVLAGVPASTRQTAPVFLAADGPASLAMQTTAAVTHTDWGMTMVSPMGPDGCTYDFEPGGAS